MSRSDNNGQSQEKQTNLYEEKSRSDKEKRVGLERLRREDRPKKDLCDYSGPERRSGVDRRSGTDLRGDYAWQLQPDSEKNL